jgi:hypothetical protein
MAGTCCGLNQSLLLIAAARIGLSSWRAAGI